MFPLAPLAVLALATAPGPAKGMDACVLLVRADAEAAVGAAVGEPNRQGGPAGAVALSTCQYMARQTGGFVRLSVERYESQEFFAMVTDDLGKKTGDEAVPGLGARAVWRSGGRQLKVVVDRDLLSLDLEPVAGKGTRDQAAALMKKVLARR